MAIYEYQCVKCKNVMEVTHKMNDKPQITCLKCGEKAKKIVSTGGFILKGDGFYKPSDT